MVGTLEPSVSRHQSPLSIILFYLTDTLLLPTLSSYRHSPLTDTLLLSTLFSYQPPPLISTLPSQPSKHT